MHGIIFARTRDGVYQLARMIRQLPFMSDTLILEFAGHGQGKKKFELSSAEISDTG